MFCTKRFLGMKFLQRLPLSGLMRTSTVNEPCARMLLCGAMIAVQRAKPAHPQDFLPLNLQEIRRFITTLPVCLSITDAAIVTEIFALEQCQRKREITPACDLMCLPGSIITFHLLPKQVNVGD